MSTRGRGFQHRQKPKSARFCPWCGVESLWRDEYHSEREPAHNNPQGCDFICTSCNSGFHLQNSFRANLALGYLRREAKLRVNI